MIKVRTGSYPATAVYSTAISGYTYNTKLNTIYACLTSATSLPATANLSQDSCMEMSAEGVPASSYGSLPNTALLQQLTSETSSLPKTPDNTVNVSDAGATAYIRGLLYASIDTTAAGGTSGDAIIVYYYKGSYGCPRGEKTDFNVGSEQAITACQLTLK